VSCLCCVPSAVIQQLFLQVGANRSEHHMASTNQRTTQPGTKGVMSLASTVQERGWSWLLWFLAYTTQILE